MADGGRYRRRRFAAYRATPAGLLRKPHQPHYQSRDYNALNGGLERWFEPVAEAIGHHPALDAILGTSYALFDRMTPALYRPPAWHVELHQFRIEARSGEAGQPTPEGMHRDGVDWVLVLMIRRENIKSGETTIYDLGKASARQLHPDPAARRGPRRRQPRLSRRHPGRADRPGGTRLSRRAGRDLPPRMSGNADRFTRSECPVRHGATGKRDSSRTPFGKSTETRAWTRPWRSSNSAVSASGTTAPCQMFGWM